MLALWRWLTRNPGAPHGRRAPVEAIVLRSFGLAYLVAAFIVTFTSKPHPSLHGRGAVILAAFVVLVVAAVSTQPQRPDTPIWQRLAALSTVTAALALLAVEQPGGIWTSGAVFVGIVAAARLERLTAVAMLAASVLVLVVVASIEKHGGSALGVLTSAVPWFLLMRVIRDLRDQRDELAASRAAEAHAAAEAERARLAREMHDVLAHSLSALALQLESTRLLARNRGTDPEVTGALDQAHSLAASGLQEARRAIATERGEELPGPERIGVLADAFAEQSGLPVEVEVEGQLRELAPDARLAVYRTAQEALTNVRRHATPERVQIRLAYLPESTVLVIEDHAPPGTPPPVTLGEAANGYGLTGMRERAKLLGGELVAEPTDDGFRVELRLPG